MESVVAVQEPGQAVQDTVLQEPEFFWRMTELQDFVAQWSSPALARTDLAKPAWTYEHRPERFTLLSCDPISVFPGDLMDDLKDRLALWSASRGFGSLRSLQISLFVNGCFRSAARTDREVYFALPLLAGADGIPLKGGEIFSPQPTARFSFKRPEPRLWEPVPNRLLAFPPPRSIGVQTVAGSMDPAHGLLLLEGSVDAASTPA